MKHIILCFIFLLSCCFDTLAKTIEVQPFGVVNSIKKAIEIAQDGDTIMVNKGIYKEGNIIIQKSLALIGKNFPDIDGESKYEIFTIAASHVSIEGFNIINSGRSNMDDYAGIKCLDAHHVIIRNNNLRNTFFAIHLSNSDSTLIENNRLESFSKIEYELGNGIHLWYCNYSRIINNTVKGHRDGLYFEFTTESYIQNNISQSNIRYGLHFMFSHYNTYEDNLFSNNGAGVAVMYTTHVKMYRNTFEQNWGSSSYGMLLKDIRDSEVYQNDFIGNTIGIYMEGTSRTTFQQNNFRANGWAIKLQASCDDNIFFENNFTANTFDISTNGTVVMNTIDGNYWDKYQGYDLKKDGIGDIPYYPVNLFSVIVERIPSAIILWRSFLVFLLDRAEKVVPVVTPENLKDNKPSMKPYDRDKAT